MSIVKSPVGEGGTGKERGIIRQILNSMKDKGVGRRGQLDVPGEGKVEGVNNCRVGDDSGIVIIRGSVYLVVAGESISGCKFCTRKNLPNDIEVL